MHRFHAPTLYETRCETPLPPSPPHLKNNARPKKKKPSSPASRGRPLLRDHGRKMLACAAVCFGAARRYSPRHRRRQDIAPPTRRRSRHSDERPSRGAVGGEDGPRAPTREVRPEASTAGRGRPEERGVHAVSGQEVAGGCSRPRFGCGDLRLVGTTVFGVVAVRVLPAEPGRVPGDV